ncbi:GILT-like protein 1 [Chionoecetes opilio]|uniref:GILT-like protein 1 n=1 Tax=Chionoecetes opilio TaxID=41210 RepID=A0A8J5CTX1_CHIOP|nr:GILT-like protein 1 [Chionoecetes opilio]
MEHGVLRGNRPHPVSGTTMFGDSDPRLALALPADHRIHGALNCGAKSCPPLQAFDVDHLEQQLDDGLNNFVNGSVKLLPDNSLAINSIFKWFRVDFGSSEASVLEWLAGRVTDSTIAQSLQEASRGQRRYDYAYDWTLNAVSGGSGGKVKVDVYFSSLCSDTMHFFTHQLYPTWTQIKDIVDLNLIPFGKAKATPTSNGDYTFDCQHGPNECHGNKVMACVVNAFPVPTQVKMIHCMMSKSYPAYAGQQCSREVGVEWEPLQRCSEGATGSTLLYQHGVTTSALKPRVYFIPTITIDEHYGQSQLRTSLSSLKRQICKYHKGPPHQNCL